MPAFLITLSNRLPLRLAIWAVFLSILGTPATVLTAAGDLDCTFGSGGIVTSDLGSAESAYDAKLQSGGNIVTVGSEDGVLRLSRFLTDGALDPSFGSGGGSRSCRVVGVSLLNETRRALLSLYV